MRVAQTRFDRRAKPNLVAGTRRAGCPL